MLAVGQTLILPGILLILLFITALSCALNGTKGKRNRFVIVIGLVSTILGGWGVACGMKSLVQEWPPEPDLIFGMVFCFFLFLVGAVLLVFQTMK
jgi:hypothetical protein